MASAAAAGASASSAPSPAWLIGRLPITTVNPSTKKDYTAEEATTKLIRMKGQVTHNQSVGNKAIIAAASTPSVQFVHSLENNLYSLQYHHAWVQFLASYILDLDPTSEQAIIATVDEVQLKYESTSKALIECIVGVQKAISPNALTTRPTTPSTASSSTPKVATALMPEKLVRDATPGNLTHWVAQFKAFYTASRLHQSTVPEQQAYLLKCLDEDLANIVGLRSTDATPIFGKINSCISMLEDKFEETYPLFVRRLQYFKYKQRSGQHFDDVYSALRILENEANILALTPDDIRVFRLMGAVTDPFLKEKFLELKDPTVDVLVKEAARWEGVRCSMDINKGNTTSVNRMQQGKGGKGASSSGPSGPRCNNCSSGIHPEGVECPAKHRTCNICQKKGHFSRTRQGHLICRSPQAKDLPKFLAPKSYARAAQQEATESTASKPQPSTPAPSTPSTDENTVIY